MNTQQHPTAEPLAPPTGSRYDRNTQIIREECESRLCVVLNGAQHAIFAIKHMNPRLAQEHLDDVTRYGALAKVDAEELTRRLMTPNDKVRDAAT